MPLRTLLGLIAVNLVWSAHPAMGKLVLASYSPVHGAWLRYASALIGYALAVGCLRFLPKARERFGAPFLVPRLPIDWVWVALLGFSSFCFSPLLQMTGLSSSRATDNSIIIAIEPLMTVFLAWAVYRDPLRSYHWISFVLAVGGFSLLAGLTVDRVTRGFDSHLLGNVILLVSLLGEAAYSVLGRALLVRHRPSPILGTALVFGVLFLTLATFLQAGLPDLGAMSWKSLVGILWLGPFGTALCYLFWMVALGDAPIASLAVTLFVQPVMGTVWGYLFLGDRLDQTQVIGAALILVAVFIPALGGIRERK